MKLNRFGAALSVLATGALMLSGCGSENNNSSGASGGSATTGASAGKVSCGGKKTLKASGSTAQANAMTRFVNAFEQACPGQTLNYTANGSGAGISEFTGNQTDFGGSDSPLAHERVRRGPAAVRLAGVEPAGGVRPDRDHLQRQGPDFAEPGRSHRGEDLQRRHHYLERSRDPSAQRRRHPARRADSRGLPQRRVRDHG